MIDRTMLKEHLALERRSITEIATGLSAAAVVGSTLYNLGFFAPIEWSLVSLLTVQDLLVGAGVAAVPMAAAAWVAMMIGRLIQSAPQRKILAIGIGLPILLLGGAGFYTFLSGPLQWTLGHLACGYLILGVLAAGANVLMKSRHMPLAWLVFSLIYIPTAAGMSDSIAASAPGRPISQIETDRGVLSGSVVRVTSAYLLIAQDNTIITMPMNKVREVRRLYVQSPEADFLTGSVGPEL
ncbi:hypothetical protein [Devosia sp.]|jgi:hypothetical protein|uniref:hypothetical protein n=1 Tax=Devosia sp. TaxID=1871048 RepID=UPI001A07DB11|nr:hypothetical protein [Devosia sp.]MBE0580832.1 hypothetical protein [Devosia sp.]